MTDRARSSNRDLSIDGPGHSLSSRGRLQILDQAPTRLGMLCLRRRELVSRPGTVVTEVLLDHELLMSSYYTISERALAEHALALHPGRELRVLVGGLGLGYTAHEVLQSERVARVEVWELLTEVMAWLSKGLLPLSDRLVADPRFEVIEADVYRRLEESPRETHDLILIDVDHNPDEVLHPDHRSFYTANGLRAVREHLNPGGVLAVWSSAEDEAFARTLDEVFSEVRVEPIRWRNDLIDEEQRDDLFLARR